MIQQSYILLGRVTHVSHRLPFADPAHINNNEMKKVIHKIAEHVRNYSNSFESSNMNSTTNDASFMNQFDILPDELIEKIFFSFEAQLPLSQHNHVRLEDNTFYFDYSLQQPILRTVHNEIHNISLVCRRFYRIIHSSRFWERKGRQDHILLPNQHFSVDFNAYEKLYVNNPFHPAYNLIETNRWTKSRGAHSQIEYVPIGSYRLYDEFNRLSSCRVTSHTLAKFFQRNVPLFYPGLRSTNCADLRPIIEFSICVAARWDCGSRCELSLLFSDGHKWRYEKVFPQWNDQKWHRIIYRYGQYDQFPSSVTVCITGCDTQLWAGFYGTKFAQTRLRLLLRTNENGINEECTVVIEPRAEDEFNQNPVPNPKKDDIPIDNET
ncbi:hypothetical protein I4U23_014689 [Adineta vaga]|nr:hypothetical protein I4U23_014689 [Adineta vaga]